MSAGEEALKIANDGKARVCARRAEALADDAWLAKQPEQLFRWEWLGHLPGLSRTCPSRFPFARWLNA